MGVMVPPTCGDPGGRHSDPGPSLPAVKQLLDSAMGGDRRALAKLISAIEAGRGSEIRTDSTGAAHVIGITGPPGAGKSTISDRLITHARADGRTVAGLLVDPSSPFTGGAILGDRVRMQDHITDPGVYLRSLANRGHLGGLSHAVPAASSLLSAVGFEVVLIETVGVGQAEVDIVRHCDSVVVVLNPGWGDGIQAAKAGLLEIGDVFVINKADRPGLEQTVSDIEQMLMLGQQISSSRGWEPPVLVTVATDGTGVAELWSALAEHLEYLKSSGEGEARMAGRREAEFREGLRIALMGLIEPGRIDTLVEDVRSGLLSPQAAVERALAK